MENLLTEASESERDGGCNLIMALLGKELPCAENPGVTSLSNLTRISKPPISMP